MIKIRKIKKKRHPPDKRSLKFKRLPTRPNFRFSTEDSKTVTGPQIPLKTSQIRIDGWLIPCHGARSQNHVTTANNTTTNTTLLRAGNSNTLNSFQKLLQFHTMSYSFVLYPFRKDAFCHIKHFQRKLGDAFAPEECIGKLPKIIGF